MSWQLLTAARTLWQEARGEPDEGRRAVAHVLWNRKRSGRWGKTLASVCLWQKQFSGWMPTDPNFEAACDIADDDPLLQELAGLIEKAGAEKDPTGGATHYYADTLPAPPIWTSGATYCGTFGRQRFYKNVK